MRMPRLIPLFAILLATACVVLIIQPFTPGVGASRQLGPTAHTSGTTTITTDTILISAYGFAGALYTATNTTYNIPYPVLDWNQYVHVRTDRAFTRLTLENDWLRVSILPELGGRVYEMIFKPTGHNELYKNPVLKPTHWGPPEQGWWLAAGGIEWGLPVEEHGYETAIPWSYAITQTSDGVGVTLRDSTQADRLRASVEVFLPDDRAVLIVRPAIENARGVPLDFKWWSNAMLAIGEHNTTSPGLRFIFPVDAATIHSTGDDRLPGFDPPPSGPTAWITWPFYSGVDWSRLENHDEWLGFFGRPQAVEDFVGAYHDIEDEGLLRIFPHEVARGIKGFTMGWLHMIGWGTWTDNGTTYFELHGGLAPTFWDSAHLGPGESIAWEEAWYPFANIGGLTTANAEAALKVEHTGSTLNLGVYSTRARAATQVSVWQRSTCNRIARYDLASIDPASPQQFDVPTSIPLSDLAILFSEGNSLIVGHNEKDCVAPTSAVDALPNVSTSTNFDVSWIGDDFYSGIASYDVQIKDGYGGPWTPWLTATNAISATYGGAHGHTYFFRTRAQDAEGNVEAFENDVWGDAFTSVLTSPAAVLETSHKSAPAFFGEGQSVDYTIGLSNTGNVAGNIIVTDTLPLSLTLVGGTLSAWPGPPPTFDGARVLWSGTITHGESVRITYALTPTVDLGFMQPQTNTVVIDGGIASVTRTATTALARLAYLPLITHAYTP